MRIILKLKDHKNLTKSQINLGSVDLELKEGHAIILRGPNGSGKSTLLNHIARQGDHFHSLKPNEVSFLPQALNREFFVPITLGELACGETRYSDDHLGNRVLDVFPKTLHSLLWNNASGGERQRALLAYALSRPKVRLAILDEPLNHLDQEAVATVSQIIHEQVLQGRSFLIASHVMPALWTGLHFESVELG